MQTIAGNHYLLHHFLEIRNKICDILQKMQPKMTGRQAGSKMTPLPVESKMVPINSPGAALRARGATAQPAAQPDLARPKDGINLWFII